MPEAAEDLLDGLDRTLLDLRRFLQAPRSVSDRGQPVELSTVLVLDAISAGQATTITEVANRLGVAHSTASRLVQRAVDADMLSRRPGDDPRQAMLSPTASGVALDRRARAFRRRRLRNRMQGWSATEVATFCQLLRRFADAGDR